MSLSQISRLQFWFLVVISAVLVWFVPDIWRYSPDGGIYVGTAESMAAEGRYWFNGYPNLLYYPGLSSLLSVIILAVETNFWTMHLLTTGTVIASLWLARTYFSPDRYGHAGLAVPILMACAEILQYQAFSIHSDGLFLAIVLAALLCWRSYGETDKPAALIGCVVLVALAPLVRFQGLFLCAALGSALLLRAYQKNNFSIRSAAAAFAIGVASIFPFALWTWRNFVLYTPDTYNMALRFFFGLAGPPTIPSGFATAGWIEANWQYPFYRIFFDFNNLIRSLLGDEIAMFLPEATFLIGGLLVLAGGMRWVKRSTAMEWAFVGLALGFMLYGHFRANSLNMVTRYWLPVLPFILVSAAFGTNVLMEKLAAIRLRPVGYTVAGVLAIAALHNGAARLLIHTSPDTYAYYRNANETVSRLAEFVRDRTGPEAAIATTEWGVMPRALGRKSYLLLADDTHVYSLRVIDRYGVEYLTVLDDMGRATRPTWKMVKDLPNLFTLLLEVKSGDPGPAGAVYGVKLAEVRKFLAARKN